jgi:hypothetical protein
LFQRQRKAGQFHRKDTGLFGIVCLLAPLGVGAGEEKVHCGRRIEHVQRQGFDAAAPVAQAAGDEHMATGQLRQQAFGRLSGRFAIDVVEDQQPAGIAL